MPHDDYYSSDEHREWRRKVIRRAGGYCEICKRYGRVDKNGERIKATTAHHIKPREKYPELRLDVGNGQALCKKCHNQMHPEKGGRYY